MRAVRNQHRLEPLELIIQGLPNGGDVLDPFCGGGTTIAAAQKLNRQWIGIDITHLTVGLIKLRLKDSFGLLPVGTRTPSSAMRATLADDVESLSTRPGGESAAADESVRVPSYRVIGNPRPKVRGYLPRDAERRLKPPDRAEKRS